MSSKTDNLLVATGLQKQYRMGNEDLHVLQGVNLSLREGEWVGVLGASGSGKSTLLHILGGLDTPDQGTVIFRDQNVFQLRESKRDQFRNVHVGFVFQFYHLLPELNVLENTAITAMVQRSMFSWPAGMGSLNVQAKQILERLGLGHRLGHRPRELSGGERQRVAIARALMNKPDVLLADEPTGNLDRVSGDKILELFEELRREGQTIVMVSHDPSITSRADRSFHLEAGKLVSID